MLEVGQVVELTHNSSGERSPHIIVSVTEFSAKAVPYGYKDAPESGIPQHVVLIISSNSEVKPWKGELDDTPIKRGRKKRQEDTSHDDA